MVSGQHTNIHLGCHAIESGRHPHSIRMLGAGISIVFGSIPPRFDGDRPGTIQPSIFFGDGRIFSPDDFPPGFSPTRDVHPSTLPSSEKKLPHGGRGGKKLPHDGGGEKKLPLVVKLVETCWCRRTSPGIRLALDAPLELRSKGIGKTRVRWR